jgi:FMN reductase
MGIRIVVIIGSVRPGNYTSRAVAVVVDELHKQEDLEVDVVDPADLDLSPSGGSVLREKLEGTTGVILSTPEYHGSYSSVIKAAIENMGFPSGLAGKPVALLGVAAGAIGAVKALEHLRSVCSHVGGIVLPGVVSVAGVQKVFDEDGTCNDPSVEKRIRSLGRSLIDYVRRHICPGLAMEQTVRE